MVSESENVLQFLHNMETHELHDLYYCLIGELLCTNQTYDTCIQEKNLRS